MCTRKMKLTQLDNNYNNNSYDNIVKTSQGLWVNMSQNVTVNCDDCFT